MIPLQWLLSRPLPPRLRYYGWPHWYFLRAGGGVNFTLAFYGYGVSLTTPFLVLRWLWRLDYDISVDSTLSNHFLLHAQGRHSEVIMFSDGQCRGWALMGSMIYAPLCHYLSYLSSGKLIPEIYLWAMGATAWRREIARNFSQQRRQ